MAKACSKRQMRRLRWAHSTMPREARAVFDRHRFDDRTYGEIAAELGIGVAEVERRLGLAMVHLDRACSSRSGSVWTWLRGKFRRIWS